MSSWLLDRRMLCFVVVSMVSSSGFAQTQMPSERMNVVLIATDDCNCDLGSYGHPLVKTPNIDRLAERGVRFNHAYCQYPVCNPSRSSFMTGMYPDQTGVLSNGGNFRIKNPNVVTLSQMFRNQGYVAARIGKIYHYGVPNQIGTDGEDDLASWDIRINPRGIDREVHPRIHSIRPDAPIESRFGGTLSWLRMEEDSEQHTDGIAATKAISLLEELHPEKTGRPFFLAVGFYRPHTPYVAPGKFFDLYPREKIDPVMEKEGDRDDIPISALRDRPGQRDLTIPQRKEIIQAYYASISLMDEQLGRVVDALDRLGLSENTVIVFLSDHGYHLGAHGLWQKGDLFEGSCRVPLIIAEPNSKSAGKVSNGLVGLIDLYPTLADLCDVFAPTHIKGTNLRPMLEDPRHSVSESVLSVTYIKTRPIPNSSKKAAVKGYSVRTDRYRYTQWDEGKYGHELYDYESDPEEFTNLVNDPSQGEVLNRMQRLLETSKTRAR